MLALPRCSIEKHEIAVPSTLFPNLTNKNACPTLSISGCQPPPLTTTRKWRKMARYGANTTKENHAASPTCPVSSALGEAANFTITSKMQQNATPCNKFSKSPWQDGPSPLPAPHASCHYPENNPRPTHRRGNLCACPSPLLNGETGNRRSIHALPQFDKQEHMSHTIHKRLEAAHSHDNEEMAQNGAIWRKYNKRKPCRFSNLPCARCPGRSRELYDNEQNATECNTMQQIFKKSSAGRALTFPSTPTHPVITQKLTPG